MTQILLHPGFHKTATSSVQHFLWSNRKILQPAVNIVLLRHLKPVVVQCVRFARTRNIAELIDMVRLMDDTMDAAQTGSPDKHIVISCEGLSGQLPGTSKVTDYAAAPTLLTFLVGYLTERFPEKDLRVIYTTRHTKDWHASTWRHHLHRSRLTQNETDFGRSFEKAGRFSDIIAELKTAAAPTSVETLCLDEMARHALGPGGAILDNLPLPAEMRAALRPVGKGNVGPDTTLAKVFLALNRSPLSNDDVRARKDILAEEYQLGGWRTP